MRRSIQFSLAGLALGCAALWALSSPVLQTARLGSVPPGEPDLVNGRNLFFAGDCSSCHASPGQSDPFRLGGGRPLHFAVGKFYPPNISPDPEYGIGSWTPQQFLQALRAGVSPDGRHYYPVFPYTSFQGMSASDIRDLYAFLRTLPPVAGHPPKHDLLFPLQIRRAIGLWKLLFFDQKQFQNAPDKSPRLNRGAYLVETIAHCAECHSTRNIFLAIRSDKRFAGGPDPERPAAWVPNITQHETGLKTWSLAELVAFLDGSFFAPNFDPAGNRMAEVIKNISHLPRQDTEAIAAYALTLPPRPSSEEPSTSSNHLR